MVTITKTFPLSLAATTSGWIPIDFPLYFNSKVELFKDSPTSEIESRLMSRTCFAFAPGGSSWGTRPQGSYYNTDHVFFGCGMNNQDFIHTFTRVRFGSSTYFNLALLSLDRSLYNPDYWWSDEYEFYPDYANEDRCWRQLEWDYPEEGDIWGACADFHVNERKNNSPAYTFNVSKNVEIPTIFDQETDLPIPPSGCKEITWSVNGNWFYSWDWQDTDDDEPNHWGGLGGSIEVPPSGTNKLEIVYIDKEEGNE